MNRVSKKCALLLMLSITSALLLTRIAYSDPATTVYVDPASLTDPSSPFSVNINVTDVTDLYAWEFKLYYDKTILTISTVSPGPLLNNTVGTANTWANVSMTDNYNATHGRVLAGQSILGDRQGASVTSGTLASLSFTVDGPSGTTPLSLRETRLVGYNYTTNKQLFDITHSTTDGSVTIGAVPEFPLGAALEIALVAVIVYVWWNKRKNPQQLPTRTSVSLR